MTSARRSGTENSTPRMPPSRDGGGGPEREVRPPADHHQAGQDEDDRRERARRRGDRLDDVVLEDVSPRNWRKIAIEMTAAGIDGREGQSDLEPEIDVGRGEDSVMKPPSTTPRTVSSRIEGSVASAMAGFVMRYSFLVRGTGSQERPGPVRGG